MTGKLLIDWMIMVREVETAINFALKAGRVDRELLEYYRINLAEDSRYTFQIMAEDLESSGLLFVRYKKTSFRLQYNKYENIVKGLV